MKKLIGITGDFLLLSAFIAIISISALSVISMSPVGVAGKPKEEDVLGVDSEDQLIISDISEGHEYFSVSTNIYNNFTQKISFGPVSTQKFSKKIFSIKNDNSYVSLVRIDMNIADKYLDIANFFIKVEGQEYMIMNSSGQITPLDLDVQPDSEVEFEIVIDPVKRINFPASFEIEVAEL
jgi:hypothetical protein